MAADLDTRCEVTDLTAAFCAHCKGLPDVAPLDLDDEIADDRASKMGPPFDAYFPGRCTGCGAKFGAQEPIRADGYGGYVVVDCCGGAS